MGFFPKELPPTFTTAGFADFVNIHNGCFLKAKTRARIARPLSFSLAKSGHSRRILKIFNPFNQYELVQVIADGWGEIEKHLEDGRLSKSRPMTDPNGRRALVTKNNGNDLPLIRAEIRSVARHLLKADIARFYHTIYTHSIPWALHGKEWSKKNRDGGLGNDIDRILRNGQDQQTLGIPVGPDTSLVIAEIIATAVDLRLGATPSFRFIDDYEFAVPNSAAADSVLVELENALGEFELALNPLKTTTAALPQPLDRDWVISIRGYEIDDGEVDRKTLVKYFNHVFDLARNRPFDAVIAYAVGRLRTVEVAEDVWPDFQNLLFQCAMADPASLPTVVGQLYRHAKFGVSPRLRDVVNELVAYHAPLGHASETLWAIWAAIWFKCDLSATAAEAILKIDDPLVWVAALDCRSRGLISFPDLSVLDSRVDSSELLDRNWILAYEAPLRGWYGDKTGIYRDRDFGPLATADVSFYDPNPKTPVAFLIDLSGYGYIVAAADDPGENLDF